MNIKTQAHCDVCRLCINTEQAPGSNMCKGKMMGKFIGGYWHNGIQWHEMKKGRVLTKSTFNNSKNRRQTILKNKNTSTAITDTYSAVHHEILQEWSNDISAFQKQGQMDGFIFYMTTHPFSRILEFSTDGNIIGFSWLIILDNLVIDQLFPWRKKRYLNLSLGVYENEMLIKFWPDCYHLIGIDNEFKRKLGGWTYEGPIALQCQTDTTKIEGTSQIK